MNHNTMISLKSMAKLAEVLNRLFLSASGMQLLLIDENGETIGEIHPSRQTISIYDSYPYFKQIAGKLREKGFTVEYIEPSPMEELTKVLYDQPIT